MRKLLLAAVASLGATAISADPALAQREFRGGHERRGDEGDAPRGRGGGERHWRGGDDNAQPQRAAPPAPPPQDQGQRFRRPVEEPRDFARSGGEPNRRGERGWRQGQGDSPFRPLENPGPQRDDGSLAGGPEGPGRRDWGQNDPPGEGRGERWRRGEPGGGDPAFGRNDGRPGPTGRPDRDWGRGNERGRGPEGSPGGRDWGRNDRDGNWRGDHAPGIGRRGDDNVRDGRSAEWAHNDHGGGHRGGRDWGRDGRRDWADNDHWRQDWDRGRHDHRYRPYWNTHSDFARPRYRDWRGVRHGYYFDHGYARILSRYYHRDYYWWSYDGWRRPYRDWRVGYVIPAWLWWEPLPWDLYYMLPPAPYGCRYIYADGDILLIAIASGIILDALLYDDGYY